MVNNECIVMQISHSGEKVISGSNSLPGPVTLSNENFLYKCRFSSYKWRNLHLLLGS